MKRIKYIYYTIAVYIIKALVHIENLWAKYKEARLRWYVNQQVLASYNYDIKAIMALYGGQANE